MDSDIKKYSNIYTGKEENSYFEALGFKYYIDDNKKIYTRLNDEEKVFEYKTNIEFCFNDLKFIICQENNGDLIILFNIIMENNVENQIRGTFVDGWTYFHSAYFIDVNEESHFKWLNNNFYIKIK